MKVIRREDHRVTSEFTYDIPDIDIANAFGSVLRFEEIVSHMGSEFDEPYGDPPTSEEEDLFFEFFEDYSFDRTDDWYTDRDGGYEVTYDIEDSDSYDSDGELLN